jgi:hypothetical protein
MVDSKDGIDDIGGELLSESVVQLGGEGCASNREEKLSVNGPLQLEVVEELQIVSDYSSASILVCI